MMCHKNPHSSPVRARRVAASRDEYLSDVIRQALERYVKRYGKADPTSDEVTA